MSEEVYKKLKQLRKKRGLTLNDLAENIGLDYQQISRIERGKSRLTIDVLMKMAKALDTPLDQLVETSSESTPTAVVKAHPEALPMQEMLMVILEGLESINNENASKLTPAKKASLSSQIYSQVSQILHETKDRQLAKDTIAYSLNLLNTLIKS